MKNSSYNHSSNQNRIPLLRTCSRSTAPLPVVLGRCSKSSFTLCKLRFLRSVRTQLTAARNDLEQVLRYSLLFLILFFGLSACTFYGERVAPVPLPSSQTNHVDVMGAKLAAFPYVDEDNAEDVFGFDIRSTGLLPVRFVIDNQSNGTVEIDPSQTF